MQAVHLLLAFGCGAEGVKGAGGRKLPRGGPSGVAPCRTGGAERQGAALCETCVRNEESSAGWNRIRRVGVGGQH